MITSFLLRFKKIHSEEIDLDGFPAVQTYKMLFKVKYVLSISPLSSRHPNRRCYVEKVVEASGKEM